MNNFLVSLVTMDHINFERDIRLVDSLGVDGLHIDIMDGHFVPRYGIYPEIIERLSDVSSLPLDLHMMVEDIDFTIDQFKHVPNIEYIHFHVESCIGNEMRVVDKINEMGAKPVACINLATSFNTLDRLIQNNEIDGVMLMGIHPGVLKQDSRPKNILNDLRALKEKTHGSNADSFIGLDGAVSMDTIKPLSEAGINHFIGGTSSIYKEVDRKDVWENQQEKIIANWKKIKDLLGK
jgi:ribulose-phosphate 3-epimerase